MSVTFQKVIVYNYPSYPLNSTMFHKLDDLPFVVFRLIMDFRKLLPSCIHYAVIRSHLDKVYCRHCGEYVPTIREKKNYHLCRLHKPRFNDQVKYEVTFPHLYLMSGYKPFTMSLHTMDLEIYNMIIGSYDHIFNHEVSHRYIYCASSQTFLHRWDMENSTIRPIVNLLNISMLCNPDFELKTFYNADIPSYFYRPKYTFFHKKNHDDLIQTTLASMLKDSPSFLNSYILRVFKDYLFQHLDRFVDLLSISLPRAVHYFVHTKPINWNLLKRFIAQNPSSFEFFSEEFLNEIYPIDPQFFHFMYDTFGIVRESIHFEKKVR